MTEAGVNARREYYREYKRKWNKENKDRVKAAQARYWEKKAALAAAAETEKTEDVDK